MVRIKRGNVARKRRQKILSLAKGFRGSSSKLFRIANQQVMKALRYGYIGRKRKKRDFRSLWISRINAAARLEGVNYSNLISGLKHAEITINRKMLAQMAIADIDCFNKVVETAKKN
jgi:large subunit ribosomal protein L20